MQCEVCQADTEIGTAYQLPAIKRGENGTPETLVACSDEHRQEWIRLHVEPTKEQNGNQDVRDS